MRRLNDLALNQALPLPHQLRKRGIRGVAIRISDQDFRIWLDNNSEWAGRYALRGRVVSLDDQRTIVYARLELGYRAITGPLILAALGAWMLASGTRWGWIMFGVAVLRFTIDERALTRVNPETDPETRFLCETLRAIVEAPGKPDVQG
jgi:ABC-type molybdate transport system ATPase subunit